MSFGLYSKNPKVIVSLSLSLLVAYMATLKFLHIFFFFFLVKLGASSPSSDVKLLLEKVKPSLQGNSENLLLSSWNSVPVCQRRGVKWVFSNVSPLHCSNHLSSQYTMEVFDLEVHKGIRSTMEDGLVHALKLAMGCCATASSVRPTMEDFVRQLEENRSTEENIAIVQPE